MKEYSDRIPRIYKVAGRIAKTVKEEGGSFKSLIYSSNHTNVKGLYGIVAKTLQNEDVLDRLIENSKILIKEEKADPWLIRVLITELLFGKKLLPGNSKPVQTVRSYQDVLLAAFKMAEEEGIVNLDSKQNQDIIPRYARVNTLIVSIADAVKQFENEGWKLIPQEQITDYETFLKRASSLAEKEFMNDYHIKELLVFPNKTEFFQHELYLNGSIILQDKASCLASWILNPTPGSTTVDMCAAPGMKTTHLAAIMQNKGTLHAVEVNSDRYTTLCEQIEKSGARCVETHHMNAFKVDAESCKGVEFILVDPSCSGSGIVDRPKMTVGENHSERLKGLAKFQSQLLCIALKRFPDVKRVVYSTCSINVEENEQVVDLALKAANPDPENPFFQVADNVLEGKWLHRGSEEYDWGPRCLYSRPDVDFSNGFFIAVFDRVRAASQEDKDNSHDQRKIRGHTRRKRNLVLKPRHWNSRRLGINRLEMLKNVKNLYLKKMKKIDQLVKLENLKKPFPKNKPGEVEKLENLKKPFPKRLNKPDEVEKLENLKKPFPETLNKPDEVEKLENLKKPFPERLNKPDEVEKSVNIPNEVEKLENLKKPFPKRLNKPDEVEKSVNIPNELEKSEKMKKLNKLNEIEKSKKMKELLLKKLNKLNKIENIEKIKKQIQKKLNRINKLKLKNKKRKRDSNDFETPELGKKLKRKKHEEFELKNRKIENNQESELKKIAKKRNKEAKLKKMANRKKKEAKLKKIAKKHNKESKLKKTAKKKNKEAKLKRIAKKRNKE